ncbi:hypothetical protein MC885_003245 [Smutsia gigantea]|nr:hypothetical protein MC885_003245 [Smutsia gigantea]
MSFSGTLSFLESPGTCSLRITVRTELWVPMDVAESPERDPRSPEDEEEEQQGLSDDDILRESGSDQDLDGAGGRASDLEDEENAAPVLSQEEEESHSDEEAQEQCRGPTSSLHGEEGDCREEDRTSELRDEASSVTRELDEHELDYDEEVPEEPGSAVQEEEAEKAGAEDDEEKGEGAPREEGKAGVHSVGDKEPQEACKEKKKEDDDGEIDDGEIDDDDLEEGEVKDPSDRKVRPRPTCRFFMKGNCTWGMNCRFIHPGVNDKGNYSLIAKAETFPPNGAPPPGPHPLMPASPWVRERLFSFTASHSAPKLCLRISIDMPWGGPVVDELLPPPPPEPPTESAWERGLRHAKEVLKKATIRKEQEPDFEEKRFTVTIGEDEREFDKENEVFRDWNYRITRDVRDTTHGGSRPSVPAAAVLHRCLGKPLTGQAQGVELGAMLESSVKASHTPGGPEVAAVTGALLCERERERERENRQRERERERERDRERERRQRERERERERDKERQRRKEEWERERAKRDEKDRQHRDRDRDKEREKEKEKPKPRSPQPPSRQAEPPKKDATSAGPQVKRADEWKDPWRRSKSPKKKLGVSVSPSRARRRRKTSASSASASNSSRTAGFMQRGRPGLSPTLRLRVLQVVVTVLVLFWLRFVPVPLPVLVLQLLLQPVFQTQLLLRKPVQVPVLFLIPVAVSNAFPTQTFCQNQGGTSSASWESRVSTQAACCSVSWSPGLEAGVADGTRGRYRALRTSDVQCHDAVLTVFPQMKGSPPAAVLR